MVKGKKRQEGGCSRQRDEGVQEQRALRRAGGRTRTPLRAEHPLRSRLADQASCVSGVTPREAGAARGSHLVIPPRSAECPRQAAAAPPLPSGSRAARLPPLRRESFPARAWRRWAAGGGRGSGGPCSACSPSERWERGWYLPGAQYISPQSSHDPTEDQTVRTRRSRLGRGPLPQNVSRLVNSLKKP